MKLSMIYGGIIMSTTIYLIRHSKTLKVNNNLNNDNLQIQNEKSSLSIEGEQIAKEKLNIKSLIILMFYIHQIMLELYKLPSI